MRWILVRHAAHLDGRLGEHGREQVDRLRAALELRHVRPTLYLVSTCSPAQQTCARLVETPSLRAVQASTAALAPADVPTRLDDLVVTAGAQLRQAATAVLIGHEGGLSDLLTELTGARHRPFPEAGAVSVTAGSVQDLLRGNGTVEFTVPVADHHEAELRSKVDSKKTVATLLAGFVLTALVGVLIEGPEWYERCISDNVTIVAFATSLAFFLAAVYVYDQLAMPAGFWTDGSRTRLRSRLAKTAGRRRERRWDRAVTAQTCYT